MKKLNILILLVLMLSACGKEFLEVKRVQTEVIPASLKDLQAILDNSTLVMNSKSCHDLGLLAADEFVVSDEAWNALTVPLQKNGYIWAQDVYEKQPVRDWNEAYRRILHCNIVLDGIEKVKPSEQEVAEWGNVKGSALFFRSFNFYQLAQQFCMPYSAANATSPGIPLRLEADITLKSTRASIEATYLRIIEDLKLAASLLPLSPIVKQRPSKPAVYALLARVYLQMDNYSEALIYANLCLNIKSELIDFKTIDLNRVTDNTFDLIATTNPEIIFYQYASSTSISAIARFDADPGLLAEYAESDIRKRAYFHLYKNRMVFKGSYSANGLFFSGLATDEVLLIRSECYARQGEPEKALEDLNSLLLNRHDATFVPLKSNNDDEILAWIIRERRKELVLRGIRWEDLRRLNKDPRFARQLVKTVNGQRFELNPGSLKYTWPIPEEVIQQSGIAQNPR